MTQITIYTNGMSSTASNNICDAVTELEEREYHNMDEAAVIVHETLSQYTCSIDELDKITIETYNR